MATIANIVCCYVLLRYKYTAVQPRDDEVLLYVHRNRTFIRDGTQDGHLHFHTAPEL